MSSKWWESSWLARVKEELSTWLLKDLAFLVRCYVGAPIRFLVPDLHYNNESPLITKMLFHPALDRWLLAAMSPNCYGFHYILSWGPGGGPDAALWSGSFQWGLPADGQLLNASFDCIKDMALYPLTDDVLVAEPNQIRRISITSVHYIGRRPDSEKRGRSKISLLQFAQARGRAPIRADLLGARRRIRRSGSLRILESVGKLLFIQNHVS